MKCQKCGKESDAIESACPYCKENYDLASVLEWIVKENGESILSNSQAVLANVLDICRDSNMDKIVFNGLLKQDFSKKILELYNAGSLDTGIDTYCNTLSAVYNIDKINYIADAFYFALCGKKRVHSTSSAYKIPAYNIQTQNRQTQTSQTQVNNTNVLSKVKTFDIKAFFSSLNLQKVKALFLKNKKVSIGIVCAVMLVVVISIISSVAGNNSENKSNTKNDSVAVYQDVDETKKTQQTTSTTKEVTTETYDFSNSNDVKGTVYKDGKMSYKIKAVNSGIHRFTANERTANYNVYIKVYDSNEDRKMDVTNEGTCKLESGGVYTVTVETDSPSCSYTLHIDRPNEVKTLSAAENIIKDSITFKDQQNVYTFTASVSGRYRVDCLDRTDGYNLNIEIYNSNNERVFNETNGGYLNMSEGVVYTIYVKYSTGLCNYSIKISVPNEVKEISGETKQVSDKFDFANQINVYTYTAPISGKYRFECNNRTNGYNVKLRIYDANENRIVNETNNGTVSLDKDVKYRIEIEYDTDLCSYDLVIGVPKDFKIITAGKAVSDSISYVDEENRYNFTPSSSGEYNITANNRTNDYNVRIEIYDANNQRVFSEINEGKVTLTAKTLYAIYVRYVDNLCDYNFSISK